MGPNQPFVLQDDPLVLHALEPQGYGDVTSQAEVWEGGRQRAPEVELCFPDDLSGTKVPSLKQPGMFQAWREHEGSGGSYQGGVGAASADAHLLGGELVAIIEIQLLQASFERLHGDVVSAGGGGASFRKQDRKQVKAGRNARAHLSLRASGIPPT